MQCEGTHHTCFHYNLPKELPQQPHQAHGLSTKNEPEFREPDRVIPDIKEWLNVHLTPEKPKVGVHPISPIAYDQTFFDELPLTRMKIKCNIMNQPIGTVGAYPSGQQELLCTHHLYSHNHVCARLMACRLSAYIRSSDKHLPTCLKSIHSESCGNNARIP